MACFVANEVDDQIRENTMNIALIGVGAVGASLLPASTRRRP